MKTEVLNPEGKKIKEIELPKCFSYQIREDIAQKYYEAQKKIQAYGPNKNAGKMYAASGKLRHRRHKWKTTYGRGISRVPRKIFWRRGTQFYWQGATVSGTVGGRRAHPPRPEHFLKKKKINKKEKLIAIKSAISSTALPDYVKRRYETLEVSKVPFVVSSDILKLKTKEFLTALKKILSDLYKVALKRKRVRAGKGKLRSRKYKQTRGLLLIVCKNENKKISGIDVRKVSELGADDLWPLGRLCVYTEKAISDLEKLWEAERK